jgi:hypothetical protein
MSLKTYHGSCHCGAVRYEADIDFSKGTMRCNCSICTKIRNWGIAIKPPAFRLLAGKDATTDYQFGSKSGHHVFCSTCGVRPYSYGHVAEIGGDYVSIQVACLDDAPVEELLSVPVVYCDGRNNNWWNPPEETRHL